ncbi:MAG: FtsX-like permease family protein [Bacteroidota bacterium]
MSLIKNYFVALFRNILKDRFYAFLNIFGLAIGLASVILIFIYLKDELTFDRYNINKDRIYRLESRFFIDNKEDAFALTMVPLGPTLMDEYPEIEAQCRFLGQPETFFIKGEDKHKEDSLMLADSTVFSIFTVPFIEGDPATALTEPNNIVISKSIAMKYFGRTDVIGESMETLNKDQYTITGVFRDLPSNTHMRYNMLLSAATIEKQVGSERFNDRSAPRFWNINVYTYVLMAPNTDPKSILDKFPAFYEKYMKSIGDQIKGAYNLKMTPLTRIHYHPQKLGYDQPLGNMNYVIILGVIGLFLMIIASINYTNLTTARAANRSKEIGVRKVTGAPKQLLRRQFLSESLIVAVISGILATGLAVLVLPYFNEFSEKSFTAGSLFNPEVLLIILGLSLFTGLISGLYPAIYLASFNPIAIMKGGTETTARGGGLRKVLVIIQFTISAFMISATLVVAAQLSYIKNKDLGFDEQNLLLITLNDTSLVNNSKAFCEEIRKNPDVVGTGLSTTVPGRPMGIQVMKIEGENGEMLDKAINNFFVNFDYVEMMGFEFIKGRGYSREFPSDPGNNFIVNQTAVDRFGWGQEPVGKKFMDQVNINNNDIQPGQIIGVMKDFNYGSLHNPIEPVVIRLLGDENARFLQQLTVRLTGNNTQDVIRYIEEVRAKYLPVYPFEYTFLDEVLKEQYTQDRIIFIMFTSLTTLTIIIAAMGLLGLSAFMTAKRTRETGIRRVMGASQNQILYIFLAEFSKWVILSNLVAAPLVWYGMDKWLENFEYHISFPLWTFVITLLASVLIAAATVSWQSVRASRMNPAESIRIE